MADTYEKDLAQKSSLTTSDYIRVVGSDNVSYKQGVPSVLAGMGLSLYYTDTNSTSDGSTDSDRYKMSFQRVMTTFSNSSPTANRAYPIMVVTSGTSAGTFVGVVNVTSTAMRFLVSYGNSNYSGQFVRSSNTINLFESIPTRATLSIRSVTWAYTIDANSNTNTNLYTLINNDLPSGATCLGVVGFSTNDVNVIPIAMQYYNSNYSAQLRNTSNSSVSNNLNVRYLCLA